MIDLEQLHDLPLMTFPTVVRDALRVYPLQGSWSDEGDYYLDLDIPKAFNRMLQEVSEDLPDFFDDRLKEVIREYTGGHQFHRFAAGDLHVDAQGIRIIGADFHPASQFDIPRKETVNWLVRPPAECLVPGARINIALEYQEGEKTSPSISWEGPSERPPSSFNTWVEGLIPEFETLAASLIEKVRPPIPDLLVERGMDEIFDSWLFASVNGIYDLTPEMILPMTAVAGTSDEWDDLAEFDYVDIQK